MYDNNNIFAKILRGEVEAQMVYEDKNILAFNDKYPVAPTHILVIPKKKCIDFDDFINKFDTDEIAEFFRIVRKIASNLELEQYGYKVLTNNGKSAGQVIFHFHVHIISDKKLGSQNTKT